MNDPRFQTAALVVVLSALLVPAASAQAPPPPTTPVPQAAPPATEEPEKAEDPWYLKGRFLVGASWGSIVTIDKNLGTQYSVSPFFRWNSRRAGWGPSFGLSWTEADLRVPVDGRPVTVGHVKVRPVMGGIGYSFIRGRARTSLGAVVGYSFNSSELTVPLPEGTTATVDIDNTWALSPKADVTVAVTRRIALVASTGYVFSNPNVSVVVARNGQETYRSADHVRADAFVFRVGAAVSLF